jgi:hypothetical protein
VTGTTGPALATRNAYAAAWPGVGCRGRSGAGPVSRDARNEATMIGSCAPPAAAARVPGCWATSTSAGSAPPRTSRRGTAPADRGIVQRRYRRSRWLAGASTGSCTSWPPSNSVRTSQAARTTYRRRLAECKATMEAVRAHQRHTVRPLPADAPQRRRSPCQSDGPGRTTGATLLLNGTQEPHQPGVGGRSRRPYGAARRWGLCRSRGRRHRPDELVRST